MERRGFLAAGLTASLGVVAQTAEAAEQGGAALRGDALNPPGVRMAGIKMVPVAGGKYKVWTKRVGSGPVKVLLLHGGPGATHEYLEAMESFLPQAGIEIIYYDQLGCGNSDQPDDPSLWTLPRYVQEVEEVRQGLGLDRFVLYGHSWGGILAMEYALNFQSHLRGLVISNMSAGIQSYLKRTAALKQQLLPPAKLARLNALLAKQAYDTPEFQQIIMEELYPQMICRTKPWPEPLDRAFRHLNEKIYGQMQGKNEFEVTGNLKTWERWERLHEIKVKTLTMGGKYDEMDPKDMRKMATFMPNGRSFICENGSHMSLWDDQAAYFKGLLQFLKEV
jgi:proline iminopeptidase